MRNERGEKRKEKTEQEARWPETEHKHANSRSSLRQSNSVAPCKLQGENKALPKPMTLLSFSASHFLIPLSSQLLLNFFSKQSECLPRKRRIICSLARGASVLLPHFISSDRIQMQKSLSSTAPLFLAQARRHMISTRSFELNMRIHCIWNWAWRLWKSGTVTQSSSLGSIRRVLYSQATPPEVMQSLKTINALLAILRPWW